MPCCMFVVDGMPTLLCNVISHVCHLTGHKGYQINVSGQLFAQVCSILGKNTAEGRASFHDGMSYMSYQIVHFPAVHQLHPATSLYM